MALLISIVIFGLCIAKKKSNFVFILTGVWIWILIAFSSGLADEAVYIGRYENYRMFEGLTEPGYAFLMKAFNTYSVPYQTYKMIITAVELVLIMSTIAQLTNYKNFVLAMWMIFPLCMDAVQMRFTLGLSVTIFGLRYLSQDYVDKYKNEKLTADLRFIICVVAALFHFINILYLTLLIARRTKRRRRNIIIATLIIILIFTFVLNTNVLTNIGYAVGVGKKIATALSNTNRLGSNAIRNYSIDIIIRFSLFIIVCFISRYGLKRRNNSAVSTDFIINENIIMLSLMALLQYSVEFYRIQVGLSILNYIYISNYLIDLKDAKATIISKGNLIIVLITSLMAIVNLYFLVLNSSNIETVFIPFFFGSMLAGGVNKKQSNREKSKSNEVVALC